MVCMWLREMCSCSCLPAWVLLSKIYKPFLGALYCEGRECLRSCVDPASSLPLAAGAFLRNSLPINLHFQVYSDISRTRDQILQRLKMDFQVKLQIVIHDPLLIRRLYLPSFSVQSLDNLEILSVPCSLLMATQNEGNVCWSQRGEEKRRIPRDTHTSSRSAASFSRLSVCSTIASRVRGGNRFKESWIDAYQR